MRVGRVSGLAVQAYQKRAGAVVDHVAELAESAAKRVAVRLVKGAYWDAEIKRAQQRGLPDYPVFTRKAMTDVNYLHCARKLFDARKLTPCFATHNVLTAASILTLARGRRDFEFQRLHGMGEGWTCCCDGAFANPLAHLRAGGPTAIFSPILCAGSSKTGATSSFVARAADPATPLEALLADPFAAIGDAKAARNPRLPKPRDIYEPLRANAMGVIESRRQGRPKRFA